MKYTLLTMAVVSALLLASCGGSEPEVDAPPTAEELKKNIMAMEDSITGLSEKMLPVKSLHKMELINRLLAYYEAFPKDDFSADCLNKVHMIYSGMAAYHKSADYADTLLNNYPDYKGRNVLLQSQASNYDIFLEPRDTNKVKHYYGMLLEEFPDMEAEEREAIELRLKHLHLDFDAYIEKLTTFE